MRSTKFITGLAFAVSLLGFGALFWQSTIRQSVEVERAATEERVRGISDRLRTSVQQNVALEQQIAALKGTRSILTSNAASVIRSFSPQAPIRSHPAARMPVQH